MSDDGKLVAPKPHRARESVRAVVEGFVELIPGLGGFITKLSKVVRPTRSEVEVGRWQEQATDQINEHAAVIARFAEALDGRRIQLSAAEVALVETISRACPNGLRKDYELADLREMLPHMEKNEIVEAAHHLISLGMLDNESAIGHLIVRPTQRFYEQFDHQMRGWNTRDDALALAKLMLERKEATPAPCSHLRDGKRGALTLHNAI